MVNCGDAHKIKRAGLVKVWLFFYYFLCGLSQPRLRIELLRFLAQLELHDAVAAHSADSLACVDFLTARYTDGFQVAIYGDIGSVPLNPNTALTSPA